MGQTSPTSARAPEGKTPIGKAPMSPPDLPDQQTQGSAVWEPESVNPKTPVRAPQARRPIVDNSTRTHRDPWPSPGIITHQAGHLFRVSITAQGGAKPRLTACGQRAVCYTTDPSNFSLSPLPPVPSPADTLARKAPLGEGAASEWRVIDSALNWKPPDLLRCWKNLRERQDSLILHGSTRDLDRLGLHLWSQTQT